MKVGNRIRFTKTLDEPASGDHPGFLYAERGQLGTIAQVGGCREGFMVTADGWPYAFGAEASEFEIVSVEDIAPEWEGDTRQASAGCWHVENLNVNAPTFDEDHCRNPCVPGTRYCAEHQMENGQ